MYTRLFKWITILLAVAVIAYGHTTTIARSQGPLRTLARKTPGGGIVALGTGAIYSQPLSSTGGIYPSSFLDPDGDPYDAWVWDNFTLASAATITDIQWTGGYDPTFFGSGGPVFNFTVAIYPSTAADTQPDVTNPPLVSYQTGGNAGEASIGTVGGIAMYSYSITLPASFSAAAGTKYWVQIEAWQHGTPDWGIGKGTGGDGSYFRKWHCGVGYCYQIMPGDVAFTLLGPVADTPTPTNTLTDTPTPTSTNTATQPSPPPPTPTFTATNTPTASPTNTPTNTPTPTYTPTSASTPTPTSTPAPGNNTPGKVTGGGSFGAGAARGTFGFTVNYVEGWAAPRGNLTYQDHAAKLRFKAISFDLLVIDGNLAAFEGTGKVNGQTVRFRVEVSALRRFGETDTFRIFLPALDNYSAGGGLSGGRITIHAK